MCVVNKLSNYRMVQKSGHPYCFSGVRFLDHLVCQCIIINVKINVALIENASRTRYTIKIKLKLRK